MSAVTPSPRSAAEPMAFTPDEFLRGTVAAWLAFNLLFDVTYAALAIVTSNPAWGPTIPWVLALLMYAVPIALVVSGIVTLLCCGAAWGLGRALRRRSRLGVHIVAYAALGAAIGLLVVVAFQLIATRSLDLANGLALITLACSAAAVPLGWGWTVRRSQRREAGRIRAAQPGVDEAVEDAL